MLLLREKHVKFFKRSLQLLPASCSILFDRKPMLAFFSICGLDILDVLWNDQVVEEKLRKELIEWIYSLQYINEDERLAGFIGGFRISDSTDETPSSWDAPNLSMTYTSIASLLVLGDDLSRLRRKEILNGVRRNQQEDGSFAAEKVDGDIDMRFVYCAICICYMLNDFSTIDVENSISYILSCLTYEGAFACAPDAEAHGGSTFCGVASLHMLGRLDVLSEKQRQNLTRWLLFRQETGFNGRPHKLVDTCYSFWVGGALKILGALKYSDSKANREHLLNTQCPITGGLGKHSDSHSDLLHAYLGLSGLSFLNRDGLPDIFAPLNITERAHERMKKYHETLKQI